MHQIDPKAVIAGANIKQTVRKPRAVTFQCGSRSNFGAHWSVRAQKTIAQVVLSGAISAAIVSFRTICKNYEASPFRPNLGDF